jgi:hypothetical protein
MYSIAYNNVTKKLLFTRYDDSIGVEKPTAEFWLADYCENNNLNPADYTAVDLTDTYNKNQQVILGNHVYNESTGAIEADPNWVAPPPVEPSPPPEPVAPSTPSKDELLAQLLAIQAQIEALK